MHIDHAAAIRAYETYVRARIAAGSEERLFPGWHNLSTVEQRAWIAGVEAALGVKGDFAEAEEQAAIAKQREIDGVPAEPAAADEGKEADEADETVEDDADAEAAAEGEGEAATKKSRRKH